MSFELDNNSNDSEVEQIKEYIQQLSEGSPDEQKQAQELFENPDQMKQLIKYYTESGIKQEKLESEPLKSFWAFLNKNLPLTFIEKEDEDIYDCFFRASKLRFMISKPSYDNTFQQGQNLDQLRMFFKINLNRAIGTNKSKMNERTMQSTSISKVSKSNTEAFEPGERKKGMINKLTSWL